MTEVWNKYADTAARKHGRPGREARPKSTTIDAHAHVSVPRAAEFIKPHLDISTIPLAHYASDETKALNAKQEADIRSRIGPSYDERFAIMDAMGVDMQLVMPPPPQCYFTVPVEIAVKATRVLNDGIAEYVARKADRFVALGTVPLQDGKEAATELERSTSLYDQGPGPGEQHWFGGRPLAGADLAIVRLRSGALDGARAAL